MKRNINVEINLSLEPNLCYRVYNYLSKTLKYKDWMIKEMCIESPLNIDSIGVPFGHLCTLKISAIKIK